MLLSPEEVKRWKEFYGYAAEAGERSLAELEAQYRERGATMNEPVNQELAYELLKMAEARGMTAKLCDHEDFAPTEEAIEVGELKVENKESFIIGDLVDTFRHVLAIEFDADGVNIYM